MLNTITQSKLHSILDYDPDTGIFTWKIAKGKSKIGKIAGNTNSRGYIRIMINSKQYLAHRLAWLYVNGEMPNQIDHINRNKSDNYISNLRNVSNIENHMNKGIFSNNKVSMSGIEFNKNAKKWRVRIQKEGKRFLIGYFNDLQEAKEARMKAQKELGFHDNCNK